MQHNRLLRHMPASECLMQSLVLPDLVVHADWGINPKKRVAATARLRPDGRYGIEAPWTVGTTGSWRQRLDIRAATSGTALVGFDFPIGVPDAYARRAGITSFRERPHELRRR